MKKYQVEIVEKIVFQVSVEAANETEAENYKDAVVHKTDWTYPVTVYAGELPKEV